MCDASVKMIKPHIAYLKRWKCVRRRRKNPIEILEKARTRTVWMLALDHGQTRERCWSEEGLGMRTCAQSIMSYLRYHLYAAAVTCDLCLPKAKTTSMYTKALPVQTSAMAMRIVQSSHPLCENVLWSAFSSQQISSRSAERKYAQILGDSQSREDSNSDEDYRYAT